MQHARVHRWLNVGCGPRGSGLPPPGLLAELWAPVGLRYHALHHLLASVPYHSYPEAHRRLAAHLGAESTYEKANYPGLLPLVGKLVSSTMRLR